MHNDALCAACASLSISSHARQLREFNLHEFNLAEEKVTALNSAWYDSWTKFQDHLATWCTVSTQDRRTSY